MACRLKRRDLLVEGGLLLLELKFLCLSTCPWRHVAVFSSSRAAGTRSRAAALVQRPEWPSLTCFAWIKWVYGKAEKGGGAGSFDGWRGKRCRKVLKVMSESTNSQTSIFRGDLLLFLDEFLEFLGFLLGVGSLCVEVVFEARCEGHESRLRLRRAKRYACQEGERRRTKMKGVKKLRNPMLTV